MKKAVAVGACAAVIFSAGQAFAQTCPRPLIGPDVIVGDLTGPQNYTPTTAAADVGYDALALGTTSCNLGNVPLQWYNDGDVPTFGPDIANKHPAIAGHLYRFTKDADGGARFEQIGQSWLKHGFTALQGNVCCTNCERAPNGNTLGLGCSDPYSASRNGGQSPAGPKYQVNANTGAFPYPLPARAGYSGETARRIRVAVADLTNTNGGPTANVRYFGESQYISPDDALAGNGNNNASVREMRVSSSGSHKQFDFTTVANNPYNATQRQKSAIRLWKEIDPRVVETPVQIPGEGFLIVSSRAYRLNNRMWRYEYAVYNMNSDRSVGSIIVPTPGNVSISNVGFHDVDYHSGDGLANINFEGVDWTSTKTDMAVIWSTMPFAANQNANAIRWGNTFNFRFDTIAQPSFTPGSMLALGLFKPGMPGDPDTVDGAAVVPAAPGDASQIFMFLDGWFASAGQPVNTDRRRQVDFNADNVVNPTDIFMYLDAWFANS